MGFVILKVRNPLLFTVSRGLFKLQRVYQRVILSGGVILFGGVILSGVHLDRGIDQPGSINFA